MCINPSFIWVQRGPNYEQQEVACRQCWRCRENRVNDYVARSLAEASTSTVTATVTLTYASRDDLADKVLHPRHFQLFMKLLRRAGHKVRYLVAGEYGELKGRAHFHALLFFQHLEGPKSRTDGMADGEWRDGVRHVVPAYNPGHILNPASSEPFSRLIPQKRMVHIREWPHGHITVDWSASEKSARYVCKYLLADNKNNAWFSLSKKPALGAAWFARKAALARELGVLPSSFEYIPPGGSKDKRYLMTGATRRDYLDAVTQDDADREKMSEWVQKSFDKAQLRRMRERFEELPPSEQWEAFDRLFEALQEQKAMMMAGHAWRNDIEWLLQKSTDGILWLSSHKTEGDENGQAPR